MNTRRTQMIELAGARRVRSLLGILALLSLASIAHGDRVRNVSVGEEVPPFAVRTLAGAEIASKDLRGKVVVVVYVAAEQKSSEQALRAANTVQREIRSRDLTTVFMTADTVRVGYFRQQRSRLDLSPPLGLDIGREFYGALGVIVLPTTIVIDREGRLAHVLSSYKSDYDHVLAAYVRHALGDVDDAELAKLLERKEFVRDRPADRIARHRAAAELLREKDLLPDAVKELEAALAIDASDAETQLDLATLLITQGDVERAAMLVDKVTTTEPYHRRGKLVSGMVLYHRGRFDEAEAALEEALLLNPDPARTHYYLGLVKERQGDQAAAIAHFKEALVRLLKD